MKTYNRRSIYITVLSFFLAIIFWITMAPAQLGGRLIYVIVDGNSMEPRFHLGDLVIVRKRTTYQVGDAVTYQNAELGRFVFHRITGLELDRFILQGDNNSWLDSYHPNQEEIIGKLWVHIPKLGMAIEWVRIPIHLGIIVGLFGGILMTGMIQQPSRGAAGRNNTPSNKFGGILAGALIVIGIFALAFLSFGVFAFTRPLTRPADNIQYQQEGSFFYSAIGTPGIYDKTTVQAGEPIFPNLTCLLNVGFNYNLLAAQSQGTSGTYQMNALILDEQSGWQRTIPLVPPTAFNSNTYLSMAAVDLCQVEALVALVEQETGLHSNLYTFEIVSQVSITSNVAGTQINDMFDPSMVFKFDKVHFFLASDKEDNDQLRSSKTGIAISSALEANTMSLLGWRPTVQLVRGMSLLGLGLALAAALISGWYLFNGAKQNQDALIRLKYGGLLMDVHESNIQPYQQIVDVASIDDLARLAERQNMLILHMRLNFLHYYLIQVDGTTYRYLITTGKQGMIEAESTQQNMPAYVFEPDQYELPEARPSRPKTAPHVVDNYETQERAQYQSDVIMLQKIKI